MADPVLIVRELERSIFREVDVVDEAHLTDELRKNLASFDGSLFGQPFWPTLLAIGGALGFGLGATLLRQRAR